ncbi:hypothetical protein scyTo_0019404, partial [Scyliorhinus torazame]|nr:hypothetical protein [Scyliorhinus torazame]
MVGGGDLAEDADNWIQAEKKIMDEREPMTYDEFYDTVQDLFHDELKTEYIKAIFKKININLEAPIDWCE